MSKAFVIKFNNNYYWCGYNNSDKQLRKAVLYKSIKMAEETAKDCMNRIEYIRPYENKIENYKIIEITIAEVDKNLTPQNYDNLSIEDKLKYRENQVRIAGDRDMEYNDKITELEFTIKQKEQQLAEKDKEIEELKTRISELEDKDWYEKCISQLEEQNNKLIKERDELAFEKRNTFGLIEKMSNKCQLEIRKQVCDEIREKLQMNENNTCENTAFGVYYDYLKEILDEIEKGEPNER